MLQLNDEVQQKLLDKLEELNERFHEIERQMTDPELAGDGARLSALAQQHGRLSSFARLHDRLQELQQQRQEAEEAVEEFADEPAMRQLAEEELSEATSESQSLMQELVRELLAGDKHSGRSVIMEIRPGTGGDEAALFARDLLNMYTRYAEQQGWSIEPMSITTTDLGGIKEAIVSISGAGVWDTLRYESGGHRVQRVPETESQGRIHTSLATVAVLPEAREVEVEIDENDLDVSFMRSSGPGGQSVNKTSSCVRIVHKPTGITVRCQDEKSQRQNRKKAMKILRARIYEMLENERQAKRDRLRRSQVGTGDRNQRVRTYNFPQDRITDHRIGLDIFGIESFMMGDSDRMFDALAQADREDRLAAFAEGRDESLLSVE